MKILKRLTPYLAIFLLAITLSYCKKSADPQPAQKVEIKEVYFSDPKDFDGDGFVSYFKFNFELDINTGSKQFYVWLGVRFNTDQDTASYFEYYESVDLTAASGSNNSWFISVGGVNGELPFAAYDFLFIVFDPVTNERIDERSAGDLALLSNVPIEYAETDIGVSIFNAWFEDEVDNDGDGYDAENWMWVDVDESDGGGVQVFLDLYYRPTGTTPYTYIGFTNTFSITGNATTDAVGFPVTDYVDFSHGSYDFWIDVLFDGWYNVEDTRNPANDLDLSAVPLELPSEDQVQIIYVGDAIIISSIDLDADGYKSEITYAIDVDVSSGSANVFMQVYAKQSFESVYTPTFPPSTPVFSITGSSSNDAAIIGFSGFPHGEWDFQFKVLREGSSIVEDTYDDTDDNDLKDVLLELLGEDE